MVDPITEDDARAALRAMQSAAANPSKYAARRLEHGWLFTWRIEQGPPLMGTRSWVVADNGVPRVVDMRQRADDVIADVLKAGNSRP